MLLFLEVQSRCIERLMRSVRLLGRLGPALLGSPPFLVISWLYQAGPNVHHSFQAALCTSHDARVGVRLMLNTSSVWSDDFSRICRNSIKQESEFWILVGILVKWIPTLGHPQDILANLSVLGEIPAPVMPFNRVFWVIWLINRVFRPSQLAELSRSEFDPEIFSHSAYDKFWVI